MFVSVNILSHPESLNTEYSLSPGFTGSQKYVVHKSAVKSDHTFFLLASDSYGQVSLDRSQIVDVVDQTGRDWWKVSDAMGRQGYYPSHYLKII